MNHRCTKILAANNWLKASTLKLPKRSRVPGTNAAAKVSQILCLRQQWGLEQTAAPQTAHIRSDKRRLNKYISNVDWRGKLYSKVHGAYFRGVTRTTERREGRAGKQEKKSCEWTQTSWQSPCLIFIKGNEIKCTSATGAILKSHFLSACFPTSPLKALRFSWLVTERCLEMRKSGSGWGGGDAQS